MSCLSALENQVLTLLTSPKDILFLRHNVYREYGKIALGPDFIHTFPSFIIIISIGIVIRRYLRLDWLNLSNKIVRRIFQVVCSWILINAVLWNWLILQGVLYCSVWNYWNNNLEFREIAFPWWQRVWESFYPAPSQPPVLSASLISWILSMSISGSGLIVSLNVNILKIIFKKVIEKLSKNIVKEKIIDREEEREREISPSPTRDVTPGTEKSDMISIYDDDYQSEISGDFIVNNNTTPQREISPVSYGTNWIPNQNFQRNSNSMKLIKSSINGSSEFKGVDEEFPSKQTRNRRGCHTVSSVIDNKP